MQSLDSLEQQNRQSILFESVSLAGIELKNRIVMAPMTRSFSPGGTPGPDVAAYYRRRAENGVGLIITEGSWIPHLGAANDDNAPYFYGDAPLAEWSRILQGVHAAGGRMMPQLWHAGLMLRPEIEGVYEGKSGLGEHQCGPSGMVGGMGIMPEKRTAPMTQADIDAVVDAYARSAAFAHEMGFDGIELHGAHGYLIDQFLWEHTNLRDDRYGGDIERRTRFVAEVIQEIRRRTSPSFPISLRFSQWKGHDFGAKLAHTPQELERMLRPIVDAGVDMFDCSTRRFWEPEFENSDLNLAGWTRKVSGKVTMTVGSVSLNAEMFATFAGETAGTTKIDRLLEMLEQGDFDLVGVGRALIANPDWPGIVRADAWDRLQPYTPSLLETLV
jgi:2,4-dienoyl-CoA reductase-like NADH-dependent reductase (Old Yellow Enzyme family)